MKKLNLKPCPICRNDFKPKLSKQIYCSRNCVFIAHKDSPYFKKGKDNPLWKGGHHNWKLGSIRHHTRGYIEIWTGTKWKTEHRILMEKFINRPLTGNEHIHHINGITNDNRIENLVILTKAQHNTIHKKEQSKNWKRNSKGQWT